MSESGGDKKHEATPYRRQKAREDGNIAKSQDLASALLLLAGIYMLDYLGGNLVNTLKEVMTYQLTTADYRYQDTNTAFAPGCEDCLSLRLGITAYLRRNVHGRSCSKRRADGFRLVAGKIID